MPKLCPTQVQVIAPEMTIKTTSNNLWRHSIGLSVILGLPMIVAVKQLWRLWHSDPVFEGLLLVPFLCGLLFIRHKNQLDYSNLKPKNWILYLVLPMLASMLLATSENQPRWAGFLLTVILLTASFGLFARSHYNLFIKLWGFLVLMVPPPQWIIDTAVAYLQMLFAVTLPMVLPFLSDHYTSHHGFTFWFSGIECPMIIGPECSGIRSLLGLIIVSSFLAVHDRHSSVASILMIASGIINALVLNGIRIFITMQMRIQGFEKYSIGFWHGLLGITIFIVGFINLSLLSMWLNSRKGHRVKPC